MPKDNKGYWLPGTKIRRLLDNYGVCIVGEIYTVKENDHNRRLKIVEDPSVRTYARVAFEEVKLRTNRKVSWL